MTNQEWLSSITPIECYKTLGWLFNVYGKQFTSSELAITQWLEEEREMTNLNYHFCPLDHKLICSKKLETNCKACPIAEKEYEVSKEYLKEKYGIDIELKGETR